MTCHPESGIAFGITVGWEFFFFFWFGGVLFRYLRIVTVRTGL
jgi:hypothetical protein